MGKNFLLIRRSEIFHSGFMKICDLLSIRKSKNFVTALKECVYTFRGSDPDPLRNERKKIS
ncbi:Uncharacterized protein dnm_029930 [Desulfonema magnum]|uniref:Uncharacterized protein n=1 Tax=Desulfonema magnum TaxID=45655 RepID=A0A975GMJ5_9BACT|nr:Uncharacterized protein dnm_029930 [Desulfonema magnum]